MDSLGSQLSNKIKIEVDDYQVTLIFAQTPNKIAMDSTRNILKEAYKQNVDRVITF